MAYFVVPEEMTDLGDLLALFFFFLLSMLFHFLLG